MPELPEVETIRRGLEGCVIGKKIRRVKVFEGKEFVGKSEDLKGREIVGLRRFGKALVMDLEGGLSVICHLRMTGQMVWVGGERIAGGHPSEDWLDELPNKHTRVEIEFDRGRLFFNDQRKFGFMKVVQTEKVLEDGFIAKLGKEPWQMTTAELFEKLQRHKKAKIKTVLLDQTVMAGLGNIYADETLHFAGVGPERLAGEISEDEVEKILEGARTVMERSLEAGGSSLRNYVRSDGSRGDYLDLFAKVYNREGKECEKCGNKIVKIRVCGRGTYYCKECQR